jgi:CRP/FNR family transcriptional regulator
MVLKECPTSGVAPGDLPEENSGCSKGNATEIGCRSCSLDPLCLLLGYGEADSALPDGILLRRRPVARGESIFRFGDPFHSIFAVKSGSFKTLMPGQSGHDQIIGFYLPGEIIGTAGFAEGSYPCTARALEVSNICELRLDRLSESGKPAEVLQRAIIELLGKEVAFNNSLLSSLIRQSAEQRIGAFLLNLSERLEKRGKFSIEFTLGMSRSDIGSYLGLASETVSRVLTRFQKAGLLSLDKKRVRLLDPQGLAAMVEKT